ncbi:MAG: hypothetical protein EBT95_06760, partial [Verrucomicrobia bacterium]|nr:hypothetical protein [Verrucomicrobiota bacterium]
SPRLPGRPPGNIIEKALYAQQEEPYFPAGFPELKARISFREVQPGEEMRFASHQDEIRVQSALTRHPGGCFAYRFDGPGQGGERSLVFATDNEPPIDPASPLLKMTRGADLLISDGQYTEEEHEKRRGWGHGTPALCLQEALTAGAKRLLVTHFDPGHADHRRGKSQRNPGHLRPPKPRPRSLTFARNPRRQRGAALVPPFAQPSVEGCLPPRPGKTLPAIGWPVPVSGAWFMPWAPWISRFSFCSALPASAPWPPFSSRDSAPALPAPMSIRPHGSMSGCCCWP